MNGDSVEVTITDVASFVVKANGTATGPGSLTVGPIYTNTLFDGTVTIAVTMTDPAGNSTTGAASAGDKGTTAPGAPAAVSLLAGAMNGPNVVNGTNVSSANIDCDAGVGNDPSRSISFRAFLGASEVTQTASAPTGGATISFTGVDLASLPDGTLTLESWHTDGFGNESSRISTPVTKDVLPPATPTAAHIAASSSNPQGFINASSQGGVSVEVTFPATYAGTEICRITLSDSGSGVVNSGVFSPLPGGSTFTVGAINAASLADGSITIGVTATDWTGNQASYSIGAGTKDITGPAAPSSLAVAMTQQNAANIINGMTETAVEVAVNYDSSMTGTETAVLSLSGTDIPDQVLSPPTAVPSGGGMSLFTIDTDKITDGTVNVHIRINDVAGNATNFFGTAALKDTVFPAVPTSAAVIVGGSNPVNVINSASQASAQVDVGFGASSVATDLVALTMTSGTASLSWGPLSAPSGTGTLSFAGLDFSAGDTFPEGTVSIQISVQDINGNITTFAGTPATKDTFAPPPPTSFAINGTSDNPANFINSTTASSVQVTVGYSAAYAGDESMTVTLSDSGSGTASSPTFSPPAEGNSLTFIVDASSLADGAITLELLSADPAGNSAMFPGTPATKDVSAPAAATALAVAVTGSNPANVINSTTETAAQFDITYDGSMTGTETAILRLTGPTGGEPTTVEIGPIAVPASGGPFSWIADTSKLADGAMILQIQITDPSGNKTTFTGTGATKDTAAPASVTGAFVAAGGMNAVNVINSNSVGAVQVDVSFDSSSVATDTVTVTLTQGASMVTTGSMAAPAGAGTLNFTAINTSALTEGLVTVTVDVVDTNLNTSTTPGTAALKDTQAAAAPTASFIVQGANNPANVINSNNSAAVQVQVDYPASWDGNVTAQVELVDSGSGTASSAALSPSSAGTTITFSVNASSLADGAITVQVVTTDENQNAMTYAGTAATMDTAPPVAPSALAIASGGSNPADVINIATETSYQVDVTYDGSMAGTELAFLHVTGVKGDGTTTDTFGPFAVPASGGPASFAGLSSIHFADGAVTLAIDVFDAAGNPVTFAGTAGLKDTVAPPAPTLAVVPSGGSNPANFINIATVANFQVDVTWDSAADGTATAIVTVEDGSNPVVSGSMAVSPSSTVVYGSLDASLVVQGSHVIRVDVTDPNQNLTTFTGTPVVADTIAPTAPSALQVAAGSGNDAQIINLLNVGNVTMDVTYHSSMVGDEMALITLTSGASAMSALTAVPASGGAAQISGIDVTALTDGTLAVAMSIDVTDPAGNTTNFAGPANATKDTTPPVAASSAGVVDSGGSVNPPNYVNMASDAIVAVDVGMAAGALVGDEVTITLTGGAMMVSPTPFTLVAPGVQTVSFTAIDLSLFPDGPITIAVSVEDPNRNPATSVGTPAIKDVVPPALPTFAGISATGQNPVNFVNLASQNTVEVLVTFAATSLSTDVVTVNITDIGVGNMNYGPTNATDGTGDLVFVNQDFSSLMDGALTVNITVADLAGNSANGLGSAATKDTAAPTAPTAFLVAAGGMNAINVVNSFSGAAVQLDVTYHASTAGDETVQLTITSGGGGAFMLTPPTPPAGASTQMYTGNDFVGAGVLDGALTLNGTFTDPAGNATPFTGTAAIMDTAPPILPTGASVIAGGMNAADVINMFNQASAQVDVAFGTFDTNDQVTLTLTDMGSTPLVVGPVASAALVSFATINTSTLVEGPITVDIMIQDQYGNPVSTFSGTGAIKDVTPPTLPSAAILPSGPGNNLGWVSGASVASVLARVSLTASSVNTDTVDLTIDDNITTVMTGPQAAPNGAGDVDFSSINLSALVDGVIDLNVTVADQYGNTATTTINANQDVVDPTGVTASQVAMGGSNPADFINLASQATTVVSVTYDGTADANDRAIATLSDGSNMVSTLEITATPSSTATSAAFDTTSLNEASISISLALYDLAGNTGSASGSAATKDITLPQTPIVDPVTSPTNETTVNITGVSEIQNVIDVVGGAATGMGTADNNGAWVVAWAPPASATTALSVTATDPAGNPSSPTTIDWKSATLSITQDATAPDVPFADDTVPAGLGDTGAVGGGSFIDVDNDTDLDLFVGDTGKLYQNDGNGVFTDITATVGVLFTGDRSAVWADYD
ncbi:MAG: hypothetical protein CMJ83_16790, partial [Planctomycetes bacterium]|nr:hypothetical protein [Planctomycetota bacterium]